MMRFLQIVGEIVSEAIAGVLLFIGNNLRNIANILNIVCPYVMYLLGQYAFGSRGEFNVGAELFIPLVFAVVIYLTRQFANKIGKGTTIPVPQKRFTSVDEDGEVSVNQNRLQELILYTADVEDWLERRGLL